MPMYVQRTKINAPDHSHEEDIRKLHVKKMPDKLLQKGDPDFVDERKHKDDKENEEEEKSFLESLFGDD